MTPESLQLWLTGLAIAVGVWLIGWLVTRLVLGRLMALARRSPTPIDDILLAAVGPHLPIWFLALGVSLGARWTPLLPSTLVWVDRVVETVVVFSVGLALASFLTHLLERRATPGFAILPVNTLIQNTIRVGVLGLSLLVILGNLGVEITPLLTALGVGSLAVALALQPTLTNLFAGFHITLARHVRLGDYVELEGGQKGTVVDIGWRSTLLRELPDNTFVVPNARLAEMIVKNYGLPGAEHNVSVEGATDYATDLDRVERVTLDVAREVQANAPGAVPGFEPIMQFRSFGDSGIAFSVVLRVRNFHERNGVVHEFVKQLGRRYREERIEIPFPQRVVHVRRDGGDSGLAREMATTAAPPTSAQQAPEHGPAPRERGGRGKTKSH